MLVNTNLNLKTTSSCYAWQGLLVKHNSFETKSDKKNHINIQPLKNKNH